MKFETYRAALLPAVVRFWNRAFAGKRNFFPVTEEMFLRRVVEKRTAVERFDPEGFVVARDASRVVGMIHVGTRPEELCRALDPAWPGGTQGYVAFLFVEPEHRRRGIGGELWHRGLERLEATRQVVLDGQCMNPFYGNSEGPFTPFWGTPEGVGIEWDASATKKFLARKGFAPRFKGVQLAIDLKACTPAPLERTERAVARGGFELRVVSGSYLEAGHPEAEPRRVPPGLDFDCTAAVRRGETAGAIVSFPMKEVRAGLHGIYEAKVAEEYRGRALGKHLLAATLDRLRSRGARTCEVLTLPEISPAAHKLYLEAGFAPVARWAVY